MLTFKHISLHTRASRATAKPAKPGRGSTKRAMLVVAAALARVVPMLKWWRGLLPQKCINGSEK